MNSTALSPTPLPLEALQSPALFSLQVDAHHQVLLARMTENDFRQSVFLDQRIHRSDSQHTQISLQDFCQSAAQLQIEPCSRYIFHISHVGSTLLSQLLGLHPDVLTLREPLLLRWLAHLNLQISKPESRVSPEQLAHFEAATQIFLSRKFRPENQVVIKATSYTNVLAEKILRQEHAPQALFVYSALPAFLATILKGPAGVQDISDQAATRMARLHSMLPGNPWRLYALSAGATIAMSWVVEMLTLQHAAHHCMAQVQWVDFDAYLRAADQPGAGATALAPLLEHLHLSQADNDQLHAQAQKNAKNPSQAYNATARAHDLAEVSRQQAAVLAQGLAWFQTAAAQYPSIADLAVYAKASP